MPTSCALVLTSSALLIKSTEDSTLCNQMSWANYKRKKNQVAIRTVHSWVDVILESMYRSIIH